MPDLSRYKGIVFDMDGTLIDSMGSHAIAWQQTCEHFGYPFDGQYIHDLGGVPTRQIAKLLNEKHDLHHDVDDVAEVKRQAWLALDDNLSVIDDTFQVMQRYEGVLQMGIGTGSERDNAIRMLTETGLLDRVETVVTASDVTNGKPHGETFLTVAKNMGLRADECVVFEDTEIGRQAAANAGMDCIMVINGKIELPA
ncbi:beta-phosphoglucomutase family hydrolase [Paraglaciecola polaris]|uniref:Phosphatase yqaB n=1 Tax=Paraglaciecola polaris LMG 21857 TaxID=1129793 RepID=K7ADL4_9ALTE|nr:beta-phosphoglucomutase family hydrolase [Paraglaciecola polaris]GAC33405.1 phosphatase yqaB [Paraglaciecola polaris LMG 21857]|tara:strand:- start:1092 stop:1682 length:591 start_codon:yes stop_codon:yes gene_type:complete